MKKIIFIIFLILLPLNLFAVEDVDHAVLAKSFLDTCLSDKNVFVFNPPAELNPYKNMSKEEIRKFQKTAVKDGSILMLHLSGLPASFKSQKNYKEHGLQKIVVE